jgi:hypothetical protein
MSNRTADFPLTRADVRQAIQRAETLASILRMSGHALSEMPPRHEMADVLDTLARFSRIFLHRAEP